MKKMIKTKDEKSKCVYRVYDKGKPIVNEMIEGITPHTDQRDYPKNSFKALIKTEIVRIPNKKPSPLYRAVLSDGFKDFLMQKTDNFEDYLAFEFLYDQIYEYINLSSEMKGIFLSCGGLLHRKKLLTGMTALLCFIIDNDEKGEIWVYRS
jgi:hypothetical protein